MRQAYQLIPSGDQTVKSSQSLGISLASGRGDNRGLKGFKLNYQFEPGWKFIRLISQRERGLQSIPGQPKSLGLWVYGDQSSNYIRLRFKDATGQVFQPTAERVYWHGWKYITFPMKGENINHWGGAADGKIHYPIQWDTLFLLDNAIKRHQTQGELYLSKPTLTW